MQKVENKKRLFFLELLLFLFTIYKDVCKGIEQEGRFMAMVTISFIIPVGLLEQLDTLVRNGDYPTRSKIIRIAIRDLLKDRTPPFQYIEDKRNYYYYHHHHKNVRSSVPRISLKTPKELKKELERLVNQGFYPSKSEAIRVAILSFLKREIPEAPKETETEKPIELEELEELEKELEMNKKIKTKNP